MILQRITVENFRQYYGVQQLTFARDTKKSVTVVHGVNGAGKTSFFLAINWCLYGVEADLTNVGELMSKRAIQDVQEGESVRLSVELTFSHGGEHFVVKRTHVGVKSREGDLRLEPADEFVMMRIGVDGQAKTVNNPVGRMNSILPVNVREYFLFDGEKIDNFAKPEASKEIREAVYLVLKLEVLDRAARHLDTSAKEYRKELRENSGGELRKLLEKNEAKRDERERKESRRSELQEEIKTARKHMADIDQRLRDSQGAQVLQERRDQLESDLRGRRDDLELLTGEIRDLAIGGYPMLATEAVRRALERLEDARKRGEIPSDLREQFVQDLLDQMQCICGRPLRDGSPEHQRLLELLKTSVSSDVEDDVIDTTASLRAFEPMVTRLGLDLDAKSTKRAELIDGIKKIDEKLDDVRRQLKDSNLEEVKNLESRRETIEADIQSYSVEIGSLESKIEVLFKEIQELDKQIVQARKAEQKHRLLSRKLELAQQSAEAISEIYRVFADEMRRQIEAKTKEIFQKLVWKQGHFSDVRLDADFNLDVIDRYGKAMKPELSAGERQVLSLSFITAMSRLSEDEAPLVMDTPFGRLSEDHRDSITEHVPQLAHQLVLFVTDTELQGKARENLDPWIGAEYELAFDTSTGCTRIVRA